MSLPTDIEIAAAFQRNRADFEHLRADAAEARAEAAESALSETVELLRRAPIQDYPDQDEWAHWRWSVVTFLAEHPLPEKAPMTEKEQETR